MLPNQIIYADCRCGIGQIEADAHIADGRLARDLGVDDKTANFGAAIGVNVVRPLQTDVEIL